METQSYLKPGLIERCEELGIISLVHVYEYPPKAALEPIYLGDLLEIQETMNIRRLLLRGERVYFP